MDLAITKMSSKGQIVIPKEMRTDLKAGDKLVVIREKDSLILKKIDKLDKNFEEDLDFARRTEEAHRRIDAGECITMEFDEFIEEMKKW